MSGKRCHARGTNSRVVLDLLPSAFPAAGTGIPVPLHHKDSEPVIDRTTAASTPR